MNKKVIACAGAPSFSAPSANNCKLEVQQSPNLPEKYIKSKVTVDPSLFAFLSKGNNHCPS